MRGPAVLLLVTACAAPLAADTVHLVNGKKFEEVVALAGSDEVRIRMPHGEIVLPARVVARVERSPSVWRVFAERAAGLGGTADAAAAWLELALWAERAGYDDGVRQALLRAAELDPRLDGLAPRMARLGYILDRESGRWLTEADYMSRRGYRLWNGQWLPREEVLARLRAREAAEQRRREEARQERITRAIEALVVAEVSRATEPEIEPARAGGTVVAVYPGGYFPVTAPPPPPVPPPASPPPSDYDRLAGRQPGSLFPVPPRRHLTSSE